jgi:RNA polymerase sigma-70 factor (ECF subfamily)
MAESTMKRGLSGDGGDHSMPSSETRSRIKEQILILRCQAGDEKAFSDLYQRYGERTMRYLRALVGSTDAEDAQQQVWLAVYQGISRLTKPASFRTWLYQTTRHRGIDLLRRKKRESELLRNVAIENAGVHAGDEGPPFDATDRRALERGMEGLSVSHREVLTLRYWEDLSYANIALITGCAVGTVRSRLFHAKRALRGVLNRPEPSVDHGRESK